MMPTWTKTARRSALMASAALALGASGALASPLYTLIKTIPIPASAENSVSGKFATYDISAFDPVSNTVFVADRSNASVDTFSGASLTFTGRIGGTGTLPKLFSGQTSSNDTSGPDGVVVARSPTVQQVFAGNGDSTLKGFALPGYAHVLPDTATGPASANRVDELAFDPTRNVVIAVNNAAKPSPFVSLVDATTHAVLPGGKIVFDGTGGTPNATGGLEQPAYNPVTGKYYVSVPEISGSAQGGVAEIDPTTKTVTRIFDFAAMGLSGTCGPTGLAVGNDGRMMVGCGNTGATQTILLDPRASAGPGGSIHAVNGIGGEDQIGYDPNNNRYFAAARFQVGGPVLGVIDGNGNLIETLATTPNDHSVTVDTLNNLVFVPFGGVAGNSICPGGCIGVFEEIPEPATAPLLVSGLLGLAGLIGWRMRRE